MAMVRKWAVSSRRVPGSVFRICANSVVKSHTQAVDPSPRQNNGSKEEDIYLTMPWCGSGTVIW